MQPILWIQLPAGESLDYERLAQCAAHRSGMKVRGSYPEEETNSGYLRFGDEAVVGFTTFDRSKVGVEYSNRLNYFEWVTVACLGDLGGDLDDVKLPSSVEMTRAGLQLHPLRWLRRIVWR